MISRIAGGFLLLFGLTVSLRGTDTLQWSTQRLEFKPKAGDTEVIGEFPFRNTGTLPVEIRDVQTSCDCTRAEVPLRVYTPGDAGTVRTVVTLGDRMGTIERTVTLRTEGRETQFVVLTLRIEIPELITCSTRMLHWTATDAAEERSVDIDAAEGVRVAALEIKEIAPQLATARIEPLSAGKKYRLLVRPTQMKSPSTIAVTCQARLEDGSQRSFVIHALIR